MATTSQVVGIAGLGATVIGLITGDRSTALVGSLVAIGAVVVPAIVSPSRNPIPMLPLTQRRRRRRR